MNTTFLHFCAIHCPYCFHLLIAVSCTSALCYIIFKHHCASLPESAWLQTPWQINALQQSCPLLLQQSTSPEKVYLFLLYGVSNTSALGKKSKKSISILKPGCSSFHRYYYQCIFVLTRKTFIFTKQDTNLERGN